MKISHIKISNILGVASLEFSPGEGFNEIAGPNGAGKTSVLEAIKSTLACGHDATLLRKGAKTGEVVLVLDNGDQIRRKVDEGGSNTDLLRGEPPKKTARPTDTIKQLTDMLSINPIDFLRAPVKDRVRVLLESMPLKADPARLAEITGAPVSMNPDTHALYVIEGVHKQLYDERTGLNRAVREKESTVKQLIAAMPEVPGGISGDETQLQAQVDTARASKDAELKRIDEKLKGIEDAHNATIAKLNDEANAKIAAIKDQLRIDLDAAHKAFRETEGKAGKQREITLTRYSTTTEPLLETLAGIRANRDAVAKREQQKKIVDDMQHDLESLAADAEAKSEAIAALDAYKVELLSSLPIPGLEVVDGEVRRDGIPFDRLNTAQQVDIAVEIAKLRAGELGVVCVDNIELLDKASFDSFRKRAEESGLQLFVSRVLPEGEFQINT